MSDFEINKKIPKPSPIFLKKVNIPVDFFKRYFFYDNILDRLFNIEGEIIGNINNIKWMEFNDRNKE